MPSRQTVPKEWKEILGRKCYNCGSTDSIEYHHVVPVCVGGRDVITNIVPLCHACHWAAHTGRNLTEYKRRTGRMSGGRKPCVPDEIGFKALDLLAEGKIGVRKCKQMMHLTERTEPRCTQQFARWAMERGISDVRNFLDASITNSPYMIDDGYEIGNITYVDGTKEIIKFNDVGLNDDILYTFRDDNTKPMTIKDFRSKHPYNKNVSAYTQECQWLTYMRKYRSGTA